MLATGYSSFSRKTIHVVFYNISTQQEFRISQAASAFRFRYENKGTGYYYESMDLKESGRSLCSSCRVSHCRF